MADILPPGTRAPDFNGVDQDGKPVRLADYAGRPLVLYFYTADENTGSTINTNTFRDQLEDFRGIGAAVVGVSVQDAASHTRFREKYQLPFSLLADPSKEICRAYHALGLVGMAKRVTYVIGPDGTILDAFKSMNPKPHVARALQALREKGSSHAVQGSSAAGPDSA